MKMTCRSFAAACAAMFLLALGACSRTGKEPGGDARAQTSGSKTTQTQIVGKVTSVVGNQVVLAVGTRKQTTEKGVSSGSASSGSFTPTGESKTVLIPVGLTLTTSRSGNSARASGSDAEAEKAGPGAGTQGGSGGNPGGGGKAASSGGSGAAAGTRTQTVRKSRDFSSITAGMILRIDEGAVGGTRGIVKVTVLSESE